MEQPSLAFRVLNVIVAAFVLQVLLLIEIGRNISEKLSLLGHDLLLYFRWFRLKSLPARELAWQATHNLAAEVSDNLRTASEKAYVRISVTYLQEIGGKTRLAYQTLVQHADSSTRPLSGT